MPWYGYWDWDSVYGTIAGSGLASRVRRKQWDREVEAAERRLEVRAYYESLQKRRKIMAEEFEAAKKAARSPSSTKNVESRASSTARSIVRHSISQEDGSLSPETPAPSEAPPRYSLNMFQHPIYHSVCDPSIRSKPSYTLESSSPDDDSLKRVDSLSPTDEIGRGSIFGAQRGIGEGLVCNDANPAFKGIGRFRHSSDSDATYIKARLEKEISGPGAYNFYYPGGMLGEHPYMRILEEIRLAEEAAGVKTTPIDLMLVAPVQVRLAYKFRTVNSETVTPDGCRVIKGFDLSRKFSVMAMPNRVPNHRPAPVDRTSEDTLRAASPPRQARRHNRRVTWHESTRGPYDQRDPETATVSRRSMSDQPQVPKITIVPASQAEEAIESDEESFDTDDESIETEGESVETDEEDKNEEEESTDEEGEVIATPAPIIRVSPPIKGILKTSGSHYSQTSTSHTLTTNTSTPNVSTPSTSFPSSTDGTVIPIKVQRPKTLQFAPLPKRVTSRTQRRSSAASGTRRPSTGMRPRRAGNEAVH